MKSRLSLALALACVVACSDNEAQNPSLTTSYPASELEIRASATAQSLGGKPSVVFHAEVHHPKWGTALSPGPGDELLVRIGATTQPIPGTVLGPGPGPIRSFEAIVADGQGNTEIVFVREGREHTLRVPLTAPVEIVAPKEIVKGDKVTIDLTPRPEFGAGMRVEVAFDNLHATGVALPIVLDAATLEPSTNAGQPEILYVTVISDSAPSTAVSGGGGLSVQSSVLTSRIVQRHVPVRM